jgi:hypothetical protein
MSDAVDDEALRTLSSNKKIMQLPPGNPWGTW